MGDSAEVQRVTIRGSAGEGLVSAAQSKPARRPRPPKVQAKHVSDEFMLAALAAVREPDGMSCWFHLRDSVAEHPPKVVQAKLRSMIRRGLIRGCACGCRGDFEVAG